MRCILTTDIPVSRIAVFAEMAWMERRPELGLLCRTAREHGNRITTAVVQSALPGLSDAGANNVIAWCGMLGLCDGRGGLTALGEDVAETDEAPVPEQGVYDLWLAEHPVLGRRVLAVARLASSRDQRFESIEPLAVEPDRGKVFCSVLDGKERFMVRDLPTNHGQPGALIGETRATCRLRWTLDFDQTRDQWQLDGMIEVAQGNGKYAMRPMQHEPESDGLDLWKLAATWATGPLSAFGRWQADERRLAVALDKLTGSEIDTFCKTLELPSVEIPGKGVYENVTLLDVPVGPASAEDAQQWAVDRLARLLQSKPRYRSRATLISDFLDLVVQSPLEAFGPTLPEHAAIAAGDGLRESPDLYWSLVAPVDLAPHKPDRHELGVFKVGHELSVEPKSDEQIVRVPYRGGWSMRKFAEIALLGISPRRVLLCDRYVRGEPNMDALRILVESLRLVTPNISLDVWTDDSDEDFKKIKSITGAAPRSYRETFGENKQNHPHDRYLLVLPTQGHGFGWQMSNSPIHARPDVKGAGPETPLRWRDLVATRVSADQLVPALRQWLAGGGR